MHNVLNFIHAYHDNVPNVSDPDTAVKHVLDSVVVKPLSVIRDNTTLWQFNVYIRPPTCQYGQYKQWLSMLRELVYPLPEGPGFALEPGYHCHICKDRDHPSGLCPYPKLPGWHRLDTKPHKSPNKKG